MKTDTHKQRANYLVDPRRTVTNIHTSKLGKLSNKWSSYLPYYDNLFESLKNNPIRLLEIGVQNGGSLETWAAYFAYSEQIIGCDVDEVCGQLVFDDPRISVIVNDANSREGFQKIAANHPYDVIIDDGSHLAEDILVSYLNFFPLLSPGGIYVIEDTHAMYQRKSSNAQIPDVFGFFKDVSDIFKGEE
jgi:cephalosporin hydroxylase